MLVSIYGIQRRLPIVRLDGKDYFIMSGTYQRLHGEKLIDEKYGRGGGIVRQKTATYKHRWQMTLMVPLSVSYVSYQHPDPGKVFDFGDLATLRASDDKLYPVDGLEYYDVDRLEDFTGSYQHYVYLTKDWETPNADDVGIWQVPITLWGRDA